jgi:hypothetical protein
MLIIDALVLALAAVAPTAVMLPPECSSSSTVALWWFASFFLVCGMYVSHLLLRRFYVALWVVYSMATNKQHIMYSEEFDVYILRMLGVTPDIMALVMAEGCGPYLAIIRASVTRHHPQFFLRARM